MKGNMCELGPHKSAKYGKKINLPCYGKKGNATFITPTQHGHNTSSHGGGAHMLWGCSAAISPWKEMLLIFRVLFSSMWAPRIYSLFLWSSTRLSPSFPSSFCFDFHLLAWLGLATFCPLLSFYFFFSFALLFGPIKWSSRLKATTIPTKRNTIHLHLYQFNSNLIIKQYFTIKYQMQELG
jgi:hypothetical protein